MSIGLLALLDDVTALVKASVASLDDISAQLDDISSQVGRTSSKISGVVIDDAAVTPKYVVGLSPDRELDIILHIAYKSIINKVLILSPGILILGFYLPWLIQPILVLGGSYLCYEAYEKVEAIFFPHHKKTEAIVEISPKELEEIRKDSAVRTDFILSAEIVAISYANIQDLDLVNRSIVLFLIAILITVLVYGFVAIIVKADDLGLSLAKNKNHFIKSLGILIVKLMPGFLITLSYIGTVAMIWVGAGIIFHSFPLLHHWLEEQFILIKIFSVLVSGLGFGFIINSIKKLTLPSV